MNKILIFCEGITDQIFIGHCLAEFWNLDLQKTFKSKKITSVKLAPHCEVIEIGGCGELKNEIVLDRMRDNMEEGGVNLVVFDADFSIDNDGVKKGTGNHGFASASQKLLDIQQQHSVKFDYYLWHNNSSDGEVEDLLLQLIPVDKQCVMNCISDHHSCLIATNIPGIKHADVKTRLGYYLFTLNHNSDLSLRDYSLKELWNLDHKQCEDLAKFREFLKPYFATENIE
ncbi:hypothetical protein LT679_03755 [Mucilaginibacter roseus]|uniref:DUF4276 family protein n=1 Tax=Mucilaginibacter roseus TaxID=1528868 RepID=A0ABS8U1B5_9SPHI|nr:DUF3226 domain-containing protein [Mucilaginibacter roseus]MCD8739709.1 hypothetical protein [Mucilaginibacter roseus]